VAAFFGSKACITLAGEERSSNSQTGETPSNPHPANSGQLEFISESPVLPPKVVQPRKNPVNGTEGTTGSSATGSSKVHPRRGVSGLEASSSITEERPRESGQQGERTQKTVHLLADNSDKQLNGMMDDYAGLNPLAWALLLARGIPKRQHDFNFFFLELHGLS
jgi:hypothetical protein